MVIHLLVPAAFVLFVLYIMPVREAFEFDADEGINLMKASLYGDGYKLYSQIWSDQPPLFTALLAGLFDVTGPSVLAARLLVLGFVTVMVWSFAQVLRMTIGIVPAIAGVIALVLSSLFVRLSASVMIGLPSLSMAMVAMLGLVTWGRRRHWGWLAFSGVAFALSLQIKLFTFILIPVMLGWLLIESWRGEKRYWPAACWIGSAAFTFLGLTWWYGAWEYGQLVQAQVGEAVRGMGDISMNLATALGKDIEYVGLALAGLCVAIARRRKVVVLAGGWLIAALATLSIHTPVWGHHIVLLSVPMAWLVACGVAAVGKWSRSFLWTRPAGLRQWGGVATRVLLAAMVIWIAVGIPGKMRRAKAESQPRPFKPELLAAIEQDAKATRWIYTDQPMYAFRAGLKVPPETAVVSIKRIRSGNLTSEQWLEMMEEYRPEQVVLARFRYGFAGAEIYDWRCMQYLYENYTAKYDERWQVQYVRNDLAPKPARRGWMELLSPAGWQK